MSRKWQPKYLVVCRLCNWRGKRTRRMAGKQCPRCGRRGVERRDGLSAEAEMGALGNPPSLIGELTRREQVVNDWYDGLAVKYPETLLAFGMTRERYVAMMLDTWSKVGRSVGARQETHASSR